MLKSTTPPTTPRGNAAKFLSYREAWARIRMAIQQGFFLEAVTLSESIITDRLIEYIFQARELEKPDRERYPTFNHLIQSWRAAHPGQIAVGQVMDLQGAVDKWRLSRNEVVHGMVKSHPETGTQPIDVFLVTAEGSAREGAILARMVSNWCRVAVRAIRKKNT